MTLLVKKQMQMNTEPLKRTDGVYLRIKTYIENDGSVRFWLQKQEPHEVAAGVWGEVFENSFYDNFPEAALQLVYLSNT